MFKKENLDEIVNSEFQLPQELENNETNESVEKKGIPCLDGFADIYPCSGYDLLSHIPLSKNLAVNLQMIIGVGLTLVQGRSMFFLGYMTVQHLLILVIPKTQFF